MGQKLHPLKGVLKDAPANQKAGRELEPHESPECPKSLPPQVRIGRGLAGVGLGGGAAESSGDFCSCRPLRCPVFVGRRLCSPGLRGVRRGAGAHSPAGRPGGSSEIPDAGGARSDPNKRKVGLEEVRGGERGLAWRRQGGRGRALLWELALLGDREAPLSEAGQARGLGLEGTGEPLKVFEQRSDWV